MVGNSAFGVVEARVKGVDGLGLTQHNVYERGRIKCKVLTDSKKALNSSYVKYIGIARHWNVVMVPLVKKQNYFID
jgi:hypothetical protein